MSNFIKPGSTIGILGGGQLGRFLSLSASKLGYKTFIFCPDVKNPASQISNFQTYNSYDDKKALKINFNTLKIYDLPSEPKAQKKLNKI